MPRSFIDMPPGTLLARMWAQDEGDVVRAFLGIDPAGFPWGLTPRGNVIVLSSSCRYVVLVLGDADA